MECADFVKQIMISRLVMLDSITTLRAEGLSINYTAKPQWQHAFWLHVHRFSHVLLITFHQQPIQLMSHVFCHINFDINAFCTCWIIIFTRQVAKINWPIKFNDKRIIKTGYRNPTRSKKKEKYQLTTMFSGWNLTEWWVIFFPFLISHSTSNFRSSLVINSCSWTHHLKVGGPENHGQ